jgi:hypothetical protein
MDHRLVTVHAKKTRWQMLAVRAIVCAAGTLRDMPKSGKYKTPSLSKIRRTWRTCFFHQWPIFKQKKGCVTISLSLNYCSMGSSQPTSHDSVLLNSNSKNSIYQNVR